MTHRLTTTLSKLRANSETGLSPFLMAGDGGLERTRLLLHAMEQAGASCCELGLAFSDPIADGPILQASAQRALDAGADFTSLLEVVRRYRQEGGAMPIALMSYLNPLLAPGLSQMAVSASEAGIDALIIPDLPPEESDELQAAARGAGLGTVFFAAPTSPNERIQRAAKASSGFLYVVGRVGVTGASTRWDGATMAYLDKIKDLVPSVPRAVGFGLSTPHDIQTVSAFADLAIVGSAFVATIAKAGSDAEAVRLAASFVQQINPISTL